MVIKTHFSQAGQGASEGICYAIEAFYKKKH